MTTFTVPPSYQGITGIAHGGYLAGLLARELPGPAKVTLRLPPPLDTPLSVSWGDSTVGLVDPKGRTVMEAETASLSDVRLPPTSMDEARARAPNPRFADHPYPDCFICGTGDGLRVSSPDDDGVALGTWLPSSVVPGDGDGTVASEFLWAAMDCLTVWSFADRWDEPEWWPAVTGQIAAEQVAAVERDEPHLVAGRLTRREGRKVVVDGVITSADGALCARGRAVWVVIPADPG